MIISDAEKIMKFHMDGNIIYYKDERIALVAKNSHDEIVGMTDRGIGELLIECLYTDFVFYKKVDI